MSSIRNTKTALQIAAVFSSGLLLAFLPAGWRGRRTAISNPGGWAASRAVDRALLVSTLSKLPASFEPNRGQADPSVKFLSRGPGYALFLRPTEAVLSLPASSADSAHAHSVQGYRVLRLKLLDANPDAKMEGQDLLAQRSNYFLGNGPEGRHVGISNFSRVRYKAIYPGIDLVFHGDPSQLEFDLDVAPGADAQAVRLRLDGTDGIRLDSSGDLIGRVGANEFRLHRPLAYQHTSRGNRLVSGRFTLSANDEIGIRIGEYDPLLPLVIDPVLSYSTFLGGSGADTAFGVAVDSHGDFYVSGQTTSSDFPVAGAVQGVLGGLTDAFVAKFKADGSGLVYSTYLGGKSLDISQAIAVDLAGNAYVTGFTTSSDFPTKNPLQASLNGTLNQDLFITKLSPDGSSLVYSTYLGGTGLDTIAAMAVDAQQEVVLAGTTKSTDFPLVNALESSLHGTAGNSDAFVAKLKADGSALVFSTYLGGAGVDAATGVAVNSQGDIVVCGGTNSLDFPTSNALQPNYGGGNTTNIISGDAFLTKLKADGSAILFSTYWGGSNSEQGTSLSLDANDNIFLVGETNSADFAVLNPYQAHPGSAQITGFVTKFKPDGSAVLFSTYFGGTGVDEIFGSATDLNGNIYFTGNTSSADLPLGNPIQSSYGGGTSDGFVSQLSTDGSSLLFSTYLGGSNTDGFFRMAADNNGVYVVGSTSSSDFPTAGVPVNQFMGGGDGVVVKITGLPVGGGTPTGSLAPSSLTFGSQAVGTSSASQQVTLSNAGTAGLMINSSSTSGDFSETNNCGGSVAVNSSCTFNVTFTPTASGTRNGALTVTDNATGSPQQISLTGTGFVPAPVAGVSPSTLTFASQAVGTASASQPVTLSNTGTGALTINSFSTSGDFSQTNNCGGGVAVNSSCTFNITFTPTASGTRAGALTVTDNASGSPQQVSLTGTGVTAAPVAGVAPSTLTFSSQLLSATSASQPVTLSNTGTAALAINSVSTGGDFSQTNNCGGSVAVNSSCALNVTFTPTASGTRTGALTITDNAGGSPQKVSLTGTGADFTLAAASGSTTSASVAPGQTANYMLVIAPTGGVTGSLSITCSGAPSGATCTVPSGSVPTNGTSPANVSVSVSTTAPSTASSPIRLHLPGDFSRPSPAPIVQIILGLSLVMLTALTVLTKKRSLSWISERIWSHPAGRLTPIFGRAPLAAILIAFLTLSISAGGCASNPIAAAPNPGTPQGNYSLTLTATFTSGANSLKHNLTLTLNVQ